MAATDNEIIILQLEGLDGHRKEGEIVSVVFLDERKPLQERSLDGMFLDERADAPFEMEQGKYVGVGEHTAELL